MEYVLRKCNGVSPTARSNGFCRPRRLPERAVFRVALSTEQSREGSCAQPAFVTGCGFVPQSSRNGSRRERQSLKRLLGRRSGQRPEPAPRGVCEPFSLKKEGHRYER
jgi:hypothetical protein